MVFRTFYSSLAFLGHTLLETGIGHICWLLGAHTLDRIAYGWRRPARDLSPTPFPESPTHRTMVTDARERPLPVQRSGHSRNRSH
jgi:hypothetical protein